MKFLVDESADARLAGEDAMAKDFLDEMIAESTPRDPEFPKLYEQAKARRSQLRGLAALRARKRSQSN